jgi:hypothetical protein
MAGLSIFPSRTDRSEAIFIQGRFQKKSNFHLLSDNSARKCVVLLLQV